MEKLFTYEQYSEILAAFKKGKARCSTNKLLSRDELSALIAAGKLWMEEIDGTLWFFSNEGGYYSAHFYVPAGTPIHMYGQDKDVLVELFGNQLRYNEQMERELITAGYEKHDKYLEYVCHVNDIMDHVHKQLGVLRALWEKRGFTHRKAVRTDYPEIRRLWEEKLGEYYVLTAMTDAELEEMERYGRCIVICNPQGTICAADLYLKNNVTAYGFLLASYFVGLGAWAYYEQLLSAYQEGCIKHVAWVREDNYQSSRLMQHTQELTGKFFWQFLYKSQDDSCK